MKEVIIKRQRYEYTQGLQLLRLFSEDTLTPYVASFLAIIFKNSVQNEEIKKIRKWLFEYISPFVYSEPRGQTDLREKTLAVSVYFYLEDNKDIQYLLPEDLIVKYIDYASKQDWYEDTYLAFFCSFLKENYVVCEQTIDYFKEKYPVFISQENIAAISQTFYILASISEIDKNSGLEVIKKSLRSTHVQNYEKAWSLLSFSRAESNEDYDNKNQLAESLYRAISEISDSQLKIFTSSVGITSLKHVGQNPQEQSVSKLLINPIVTDDPDLWELNSQDTSSINTPDLAELGLIMANLFLSNCHYVLGILGYTEKKLTNFIEQVEKIEKGYVQISKPANRVGNLLAFMGTLIVGVLGGIYLFGISFNENIISFNSNPGLGDLLLTFLWADFLFSQIQAVVRGESALQGMVEIPIIRHMIHFKHRKDKK